MKIVYVEWEDSAYLDNAGWLGREEMRDLKSAICRSVGFVLRERKKSITIFAHDHDEAVSGGMTIPRSAIRKIKRVRA